MKHYYISYLIACRLPCRKRCTLARSLRSGQGLLYLSPREYAVALPNLVLQHLIGLYTVLAKHHRNGYRFRHRTLGLRPRISSLGPVAGRGASGSDRELSSGIHPSYRSSRQLLDAIEFCLRILAISSIYQNGNKGNPFLATTRGTSRSTIHRQSIFSGFVED